MVGLSQTLLLFCSTSFATDVYNIHNLDFSGNKPPDDLNRWIPEGGGGADIVAIGLQESTYTVTSDLNKVRGRQGEYMQESTIMISAVECE